MTYRLHNIVDHPSTNFGQIFLLIELNRKYKVRRVAAHLIQRFSITHFIENSYFQQKDYR